MTLGLGPSVGADDVVGPGPVVGAELWTGLVEGPEVYRG